MPIELTCPGCGKQLRLADEHAGKAGRCPACQATFQIPTASAEQAAAGTPFGPPLTSSAPPQPTTDLFGQASQSNPFASTSSMQSPYGGANPYSAPMSGPNMYAGTPAGDNYATASIVLGIVSIVFSWMNCCCLNLLIAVPCGVIGLVLAFQAPPERRNIGIILNAIGLGLTVVVFIAFFVLGFALQMNQGNPPFQFNP